MEVCADVLRDALEHIDEPAVLAASPLCAQLLAAGTRADPRARAQLLRSALLDAIELLRPSRPQPFGSLGARSYETLSLRYIDGLDAAEVAQELSISERQVYRDLRRAQEELVRLLTPGPGTPDPVASVVDPGSPSPANTLAGEMARLVTRPRRTDLGEALRSAAQSILPLSVRLCGSVQLSLKDGLPAICVDAGLLCQTLIQGLSIAVQSSPGATVDVAARAADGRVYVSISLPRGHQPLPEDLLGSLALLTEAQHWDLAVTNQPNGATVITLVLSAAEPRVALVIEDNEGAIELYRRYLAQSEDWQLVGASDPRVGVDMASRLQPAVILLDVMMPRQDGWSLLQLLRGTPATASIPVVICSYFADNELALALGANAYLRKPVSRLQLVKAMQELTLP